MKDLIMAPGNEAFIKRESHVSVLFEHGKRNPARVPFFGMRHAAFFGCIFDNRSFDAHRIFSRVRPEGTQQPHVKMIFQASQYLRKNA